MRRILTPLLLVTVTVTPAAAQFVPQPEAMVRNWYVRFLNREPDFVGIDDWTNQLRAGADPRWVLSGILGSEEYYRKCGYDPGGFVQTLHLDLFGRSPTPRELDYWTWRTVNEGRRDVALQLLNRARI